MIQGSLCRDLQGPLSEIMKKTRPTNKSAITEELCVRVKSLKTLSTWKLEQLSNRMLIKRLSDLLLLPELELIIDDSLGFTIKVHGYLLLPEDHKLHSNCFKSVINVSVIVKNNFQNLLSGDCRPTVSQQRADCWPTVGRQTANCQPTVCVMFEAKVLANSQPTVGQRSVTCWQPVSNVSVTCQRGKLK